MHKDKRVDVAVDDSTPPTRVDRRDVLAAIGAIGPLLFLGCSGSVKSSDIASRDAGNDGAAGDSSSAGRSDSPTAEASSSKDGAADAGADVSQDDASSCHEVPTETGGPYPDHDGMISDSKYNRKDITEGLVGTSLTLTLQLLDVSNGCAPIAGARVIIWHCDANGVYSEYASSMNADQTEDDIGSTTTTYLRGWQVSDAGGRVTFTTIYPGWYSPRATHIHVMVYHPSDLTTPVKTTQFAFPDATNATVYSQATLYPKGQSATTNALDMVFGASDEYLVAAITGNTTSGYVATFPVGLTSY